METNSWALASASSWNGERGYLSLSENLQVKWRGIDVGFKKYLKSKSEIRSYFLPMHNSFRLRIKKKLLKTIEIENHEKCLLKIEIENLLFCIIVIGT